jgi:hypothetical protein
MRKLFFQLSNFFPDASHSKWGRPTMSFWPHRVRSFIRNTLKKTTPGPLKRESLCGAATVIVSGGMGASAQRFVILSIHDIPIKIAATLFYGLPSLKSAIVPGTGNTARSSQMGVENLLKEKNRTTQKSKRSGYHIDMGCL